MKEEILNSYAEIFNSTSKYDGTFVKKYIAKLTELNDYLPPLESFILITNTSTQSYEFISDNFERTLGLDRQRMLDEGLKYYLAHYHPDELPILLKIFEELMVFTVSKVSVEDRKNVVYSWNYRIKDSKGAFKNMHVQQTPIFFDEANKPIIGYSYNTVVGEDEERPLIGSCKLLTKDDDFKLLFLKNYSKDAFENLLSNREIEIVSLLAKSQTTKQIAKNLSISEHTVGVHRKNILKKLNFNSTNEIIEYCNKYQII